MGIHERNRELEEQLKEAYEIIDALRDENASLKDDLKAALGGLGAEFREQRDQYRRERDEAWRAVSSYVQYAEDALRVASEQMKEQTAGLPEGQKVDELPYMMSLALHIAKAMEKRGQENLDRLKPHFIQHGNVGMTHNPLIALEHATEVLKVTGAYEFAATMVADTRDVSNEARLICTEIMRSLRQKKTVSIELVQRLSREWIESNLKDGKPTYQNLRDRLIEIYLSRNTKVKGQSTLDKRHRGWLKKVEETASQAQSLTKYIIRE